MYYWFIASLYRVGPCQKKNRVVALVGYGYMPWRWVQDAYYYKGATVLLSHRFS